MINQYDSPEKKYKQKKRKCMVMQQRQHTSMRKRYDKKKDKKNSRITQAIVLIPR